MMYKDFFELSFDADSGEEFRKFIADVDVDTVWSSSKLRDVTFRPLNELVADDLYIGGEEELADSKENGLPIAACLSDGKIALMRPYLWKQVKQHHRDTAPIVSDMANARRWDLVCEHLNLGREFLKKEVLVMTRGGKISGWFSEYNTNKNQTQQLDMLEEELGKAFPRFSFRGGAFSHLFTESSYTLDVSMDAAADSFGEEKTVMAAYAKTWKDVGMEEDLRSAIPMVKFMTGESGLISIIVAPYILLGGEKMLPLPSMSVKHRGSDENVWGKFSEFSGQICGLYQSGIKSLNALCVRRVYNPYSCLTRCLKPFLASAPWDSIRGLADSFATFFDPDDPEATCLAIDVFNNINDFVDDANKEVKTATQRLRNKELVSRLLVANWDSLDVPHPLKLFPEKKRGADAIFDVGIEV